MSGGVSALAVVALGALACACGLAAYEVLSRRFAPDQSLDALLASNHARKREAGGAGSLGGRILDAAARAYPLSRTAFDDVRLRLELAGIPLAPQTWQGIRVLAVLVGLACGFVLLLSLQGLPGGIRVMLLAVLAIIGWKGPDCYLEQKTLARRRALEAQLPDAMELLGIAVAAGSPVEQCFREVAENSERPLSDEFRMVDREVNMLGHAREEALAHLADRCQSQEVSSFVAHLTQALTQGSSLSEGLESQARLARETAQAAQLERIRKMPTKLDIILSVCFLPPTIVLVVAPTIVNLLAFFGDTLQ